MSTTLSLSEQTIITATFYQLVPISNTFVHLFYNRLFELKPAVKPLFNNSIDDQGPKLISMLAVLVRSLHNLEPLIPAIQDLGMRHVQYGVAAEDYAVVGEALLWALEQMLKDGFTPAVKTAWAALYKELSQICIEAAYTSIPPQSA